MNLSAKTFRLTILVFEQRSALVHIECGDLPYDKVGRTSIYTIPKTAYQEVLASPFLNP